MSLPETRRTAPVDTATEHTLWALRLSRALLASTPVHGAACLALYIVSQVMFLAALLLPWKMLVILSGHTVPASLVSLFPGFDSRSVVMVLGAAVILAFALHFISELLIDHVCGRGAGVILDSHGKTGLFNDHRRQAVRLYRQFMRSLAAFLCCVLIFLVLSLIYPFLLTALAGYLLLSAVTFRYGPPMLKRKVSHASSELMARVWWSAGFLCLIGWVLWDYWRGGIAGLTAAFVGLILARQALIFIAQIFRNLQALQGQRRKVEALFLSDVPFVQPVQANEDMQGFLRLGEEKTWMRGVLANYGIDDKAEFDVDVKPAEAGKVLYLVIRPATPSEEPAFLFKLFHKSCEALARHEVEILQVCEEYWPALHLLGQHRVDGHACIVFHWPSDSDWLLSGGRIASLPQLRERLFACQLPESLRERYARSHPGLPERLERVDWTVLKTLASSETVRQACLHLEEAWDDLLAELGELPLQIVLPALDRRMMASQSKSEAPFICNWTRWKLEPLGSAWPFRHRPMPQLREALRRAGRLRPELNDVHIGKAFMAALLYEFDRLNTEGNFAAMLPLTEAISAAADECRGNVTVSERSVMEAGLRG